MSALKERLDRLRAAAMADEAAKRAETQAQREAQTPVGEPACASNEDGDSGVHPAFRRMGVQEVRNEAGAFLLRRVVYRFPYRHGHYGLEHLAACVPHLRPVALRQNGGKVKGKRQSALLLEDMPPLEAKGLLFLDTETMGLGVGTGNVPFMIGIGSCTEDAFTVEQSLIRHPGEERAMLTWLTEKFRSVTHLVTYNGRSFDWPVLVNRFILNGWRRSGPEPGHLDFLHPSRALWKNTLPTCRLGIVEEHRLGIVRGEDVPGSIAPELYVRFLGEGNPEHLSGVYVHNEKDVLTLASLAIHFGHLLGGGLGKEAADPVDAEERFRTGVWLEKHGCETEAQRMYDLLAEETDRKAGGEIGWRLALAAKYKRLGRWNRALPMWEHAAALSEASHLPRLDAHLELAIHYEHRAKDLETALQYAETGLKLARRRLNAVRSSPAAREENARLERRIERLHRKLFRQSFSRSPADEFQPLI